MTGDAVPRNGPVDPGLQPERTRLAWSRTALAFLANGGLMLHAGHRLDHWAWLTPGAVIIAVSVAVYVASALRFRRVDDAIRSGDPVVGAAPIALTAAAAVVVSLTAAVVVATAH
ncbi:DUF202 domain-containing protein [Yinghuangia sp. YIM S09857]|uniref:DUF202 domain-containing protein n=1 Tax=Yinghuangia sp. YIM S09857 TaxID=3436929 RepID=UPI003F53C530